MTEPLEESAVPEPTLLPLQIAVNQALTNDGKTVVVLIVSTPYGQHVFPLEPAIARKLGTELQANGSAAASNLLIAKA